MYSLPAPYEPAGRPVRMEMKQTVIVSIHLYFRDQLNLRHELEACKERRRRTGYPDHLGRSTCAVGLLCRLSCAFLIYALVTMGRIDIEADTVLPWWRMTIHDVVVVVNLLKRLAEERLAST